MSATPAGREVLLVTLETAVPLAIEEVRLWPQERRARLAGTYAQLITEKGDVLQFGGGKKGEVARVFAGLARALALLSFSPGGVTFCGLHWESFDAPLDELPKAQVV